VQTDFLKSMTMQSLWGRVLRLAGGKPAPGRITIVSGLPRSGTSLMMKMLAAGGLPLLIDHNRPADEDNPHGYYEFERVKQLERGDLGWLATARGKAVKVISALLPHLPPTYSYRVIFMEREIDEVMASQRKMLARLQPAEMDVAPDEEMAALLEHHLRTTRAWIEQQSHLTAHYVSYHKLMQDSHAEAERIAGFLDSSLDAPAMVRAIDPTLYRNRTQSG
jgi:hypothetical protein